MVRVLIAEDNMPLSVHLSNIINSTEDAHVISINSNGLEAYKSIKTLNPEIVVLDLSLPDMMGMEIVKKIEMDEEIKSQIIVYSGYPEYISQLIGYKCVVGFFQKGTMCDEQLGLEVQKIAKEIGNDIIEEKVTDILFRVGFKSSYIGTNLLRDAVVISIKKNEEKLNVLYEIVGRKNDKRPHTIKGDIQGAIDSMWKHCNREKVRKYFRLGENENPSQKDIISIIKYYAER